MDCVGDIDLFMLSPRPREPQPMSAHPGKLYTTESRRERPRAGRSPFHTIRARPSIAQLVETVSLSQRTCAAFVLAFESSHKAAYSTKSS